MSDETSLLALESNKSTLVIAGEDIPFGAYQAIYHKLTKRVEKRTKVYRDAYDVGFNDIQNLHHRLTQLIKQYNVRSSRCQITHILKDDTSREHSSFERFKISDCSIRSCTKGLNYEFDFLVILNPEIPEASEIAQRYTTTINIDQDFYEKSDFDAPYFMRGLIFGKNINLSIEFSDYAVSQAIQATIDGWIESLPSRVPGNLFGFFNHLEPTIRTYSGELVKVLIYSVGIFSIGRYETIKDGLITLLSAIAIASLMSTLIRSFIERFYEKISEIKPMTYLMITAGDRDRKSVLETKRERAKATASFLFFGILLTVAISLLSSFLYDAIKQIV